MSTERALGRHPAARPAAPDDTPTGTRHQRQPAPWLRRAGRWCRTYRLDLVWVLFVLLNLLAMRLLPEWQTVPC